jgi:hypothetical protein
MKTLISLIAAGTMPLAAFSQSLILNGSFENCQPGSAPIVNYSGWGVTINAPADGTASIDNWSLNTGNWGVFYWYWQNDSLFTAQDGVRGLNMSSGGSPTESISQSFSVLANVSYNVSYYIQQRDVATSLDSSIVLGSGSATGTLSQNASATSGWTLWSYSFTPDTSTTATLTFAQASGGANGLFLDNISVVAVPEPTSLALLGLGGLLLACRRK